MSKYDTKLGPLTFKELQLECKDRGLTGQGKTDALVKRLDEYLSSNDDSVKPTYASVLGCLTYKQLYKACQARGLSVAGLPRELSARLQECKSKHRSGTEEPTHKRSDEDGREEPSAKRPKHSVWDNLLCPITLELPFDPVTAADGKVYDRWAIEKHIDVQQAKGGPVKSPMTNQVMDTALLPCLQVKSLIGDLIEEGAITGALASHWKEKQQLVSGANAGDSSSMVTLGGNYYTGKNGFPKDTKKAFEWYDKARVAGDANGTIEVARMLYEGKYVEQDRSKALVYITVAAERGSGYAKYWLGKSIGFGNRGFKANRNEGIAWLEASLAGPRLNMAPEHVAEAERLLEQLKSQV
jgi:U-box domain/Sel1 repeat